MSLDSFAPQAEAGKPIQRTFGEVPIFALWLSGNTACGGEMLGSQQQARPYFLP